MLSSLELESLLNRWPHKHNQKGATGGDLLLCAQLASTDLWQPRRSPSSSFASHLAKPPNLNVSLEPPAPTSRLPPQPSPLVKREPTTIHWRQLSAPRDLRAPPSQSPAPVSQTHVVKVPKRRARSSAMLRHALSALTSKMQPAGVTAELVRAYTKAQSDLTSVQNQLLKEREVFSASLRDQAKEVRRWAQDEVRQSSAAGKDLSGRIIDLHSAYYNEHFMLYNRFVLEHMALLHQHLLGRSAIASRESQAETVALLRARHEEEKAHLREGYAEAAAEAANAQAVSDLTVSRLREQHRADKAILVAEHSAQLTAALASLSREEAERQRLGCCAHLLEQEWVARWCLALDADAALANMLSQFFRESSVWVSSLEKEIVLARHASTVATRDNEYAQRAASDAIEEKAALIEETVHLKRQLTEAKAGHRTDRLEAERRIAALESRLASAVRTPQRGEGQLKADRVVGDVSPHIQVPFPRPSRLTVSFNSPDESPMPRERFTSSSSPAAPSTSPEDHTRVRSLLDFMQRR